MLQRSHHARCDFCRGPREDASRDFELATRLVHRDAHGVAHDFEATWHACCLCADLIEDRALKALVQRSVARVVADPEVPDVSEAELAALIGETVRVQSLFLEAWFEGRDG